MAKPKKELANPLPRQRLPNPVRDMRQSQRHYENAMKHQNSEAAQGHLDKATAATVMPITAVETGVKPGSKYQ